MFAVTVHPPATIGHTDHINDYQHDFRSTPPLNVIPSSDETIHSYFSSTSRHPPTASYSSPTPRLSVDLETFTYITKRSSGGFQLGDPVLLWRRSPQSCVDPIQILLASYCLTSMHHKTNPQSQSLPQPSAIPSLAPNDIYLDALFGIDNSSHEANHGGDTHMTSSGTRDGSRFPQYTAYPELFIPCILDLDLSGPTKKQKLRRSAGPSSSAVVSNSTPKPSGGGGDGDYDDGDDGDHPYSSLFPRLNATLSQCSIHHYHTSRITFSDYWLIPVSPKHVACLQDLLYVTLPTMSSRQFQSLRLMNPPITWDIPTNMHVSHHAGQSIDTAPDSYPHHHHHQDNDLYSHLTTQCHIPILSQSQCSSRISTSSPSPTPLTSSASNSFFTPHPYQPSTLPSIPHAVLTQLTKANKTIDNTTPYMACHTISRIPTHLIGPIGCGGATDQSILTKPQKQHHQLTTPSNPGAGDSKQRDSTSSARTGKDILARYESELNMVTHPTAFCTSSQTDPHAISPLPTQRHTSNHQSSQPTTPSSTTSAVIDPPWKHPLYTIITTVPSPALTTSLHTTRMHATHELLLNLTQLHHPSTTGGNPGTSLRDGGNHVGVNHHNHQGRSKGVQYIHSVLSGMSADTISECLSQFQLISPYLQRLHRDQTIPTHLPILNSSSSPSPISSPFVSSLLNLQRVYQHNLQSHYSIVELLSAITMRWISPSYSQQQQQQYSYITNQLHSTTQLWKIVSHSHPYLHHHNAALRLPFPLDLRFINHPRVTNLYTPSHHHHHHYLHGNTQNTVISSTSTLCSPGLHPPYRNHEQVLFHLIDNKDQPLTYTYIQSLSTTHSAILCQLTIDDLRTLLFHKQNYTSHHGRIVPFFSTLIQRNGQHHPSTSQNLPPTPITPSMTLINQYNTIKALHTIFSTIHRLFPRCILVLPDIQQLAPRQNSADQDMAIISALQSIRSLYTPNPSRPALSPPHILHIIAFSSHNLPTLHKSILNLFDVVTPISSHDIIPSPSHLLSFVDGILRAYFSDTIPPLADMAPISVNGMMITAKMAATQLVSLPSSIIQSVVVDSLRAWSNMHIYTSHSPSPCSLPSPTEPPGYLEEPSPTDGTASYPSLTLGKSPMEGLDLQSLLFWLYRFSIIRKAQLIASSSIISGDGGGDGGNGSGSEGSGGTSQSSSTTSPFSSNVPPITMSINTTPRTHPHHCPDQHQIITTTHSNSTLSPQSPPPSVCHFTSMTTPLSDGYAIVSTPLYSQSSHVLSITTQSIHTYTTSTNKNSDHTTSPSPRTSPTHNIVYLPQRIWLRLINQFTAHLSQAMRLQSLIRARPIQRHTNTHGSIHPGTTTNSRPYTVSPLCFLPTGLLLTGPSGSGKSYIPHVISAVTGLPLLPVSYVDVVSSSFGESEKRLGEKFDYARRNAPCILFFDDIHSMLPPPPSPSRRISTKSQPSNGASQQTNPTGTGNRSSNTNDDLPSDDIDDHDDDSTIPSMLANELHRLLDARHAQTSSSTQRDGIAPIYVIATCPKIHHISQQLMSKSRLDTHISLDPQDLIEIEQSTVQPNIGYTHTVQILHHLATKNNSHFCPITCPKWNSPDDSILSSLLPIHIAFLEKLSVFTPGQLETLIQTAFLISKRSQDYKFSTQLKTPNSSMYNGIMSPVTHPSHGDLCDMIIDGIIPNCNLPPSDHEKLHNRDYKGSYPVKPSVSKECTVSKPSLYHNHHQLTFANLLDALNVMLKH